MVGDVSSCDEGEAWNLSSFSLNLRRVLLRGGAGAGGRGCVQQCEREKRRFKIRRLFKSLNFKIRGESVLKKKRVNIAFGYHSCFQSPATQFK